MPYSRPKQNLGYFAMDSNSLLGNVYKITKKYLQILVSDLKTQI
jgi:hypothetical protein